MADPSEHYSDLIEAAEQVCDSHESHGRALDSEISTLRIAISKSDRITEAAPALLEALCVVGQMIADSQTDSYCDWCESHAPKAEKGAITGPVPHKNFCPIFIARAAIAAAEAE